MSKEGKESNDKAYQLKLLRNLKTTYAFNVNRRIPHNFGSYLIHSLRSSLATRGDRSTQLVMVQSFRFKKGISNIFGSSGQIITLSCLEQLSS